MAIYRRISYHVRLSRRARCELLALQCFQVSHFCVATLDPEWYFMDK
jgi:hypothetical protein